MYTFRIPTKESYAYIEKTADFDSPQDAVAFYQEMTELVKGDIAFERMTTFTGEEIEYNKDLHIYRDLEGNTLYGGSWYKNLHKKPFNTEKIAPLTAKKYGITVEAIKEMWSRNGTTSSTLGTALHLAMEQYFKHKHEGTEKEYHLPKHPFLREAVQSFPLKDATAKAELFVSDVKKRKVGQIDLLNFLDPKNLFVVDIVDYKSDADIGKNLKDHFNQMSWYASILIAFGYTVRKLQVWNYTDKWELYESDVLPIVKGK